MTRKRKHAKNNRKRKKKLPVVQKKHRAVLPLFLHKDLIVFIICLIIELIFYFTEKKE